MIKAVIFDLDGVIVSTDLFHFHSWNQVAKQENIEFNFEINNRLRGVSRKESLDIILENANRTYSNEEKDQLMMQKNQYYVALLDQLSEKDILPGVLELLDYLEINDYKIAIGSSSKNARLILKHIGLLNRFQVIVDGHQIINSKPNPEVFLLAARKLEVLPSETLVLEDALSGIEAAKSAGMIAVALHDAKKHPLADIKLENVFDLTRYLNR